jgi:hypothetical protein
VIAAAALAAAALASAPVPLVDAPNADSVAVAGNEVVVARHGARGRVVVDAIAIQGGATRRLLSAAGPGRGWTARAEVSASSERVAVRVFASRLRARGDGADRIQWRLYAGPVAGPLTLEYRNTRGTGFVPIQAAVYGDRVLLLEGKLTLFETRLRLFVPGAAPRVLPWGTLVSPPIAFAGGHVAYLGSTQSGGDATLNRIFVANLETGAREVAIPDGQAIGADVTAAGHVVTDRGNRGLIAAAPGVPPATLPGSAKLYGPAFAGTGVAALQRVRHGAVRPVVLDPGATAPRPVGVPSFDILALDADENGIAWIGNRCVIYAPVGALAPAEPPAGPCPRAEVALEDFDTTLHRRTVRLRLACVAAPAGGCRGSAILRRRGAVIGREKFRILAGGAGSVSVLLDRRAARAIRRVVASPTGFALLGLGLRVRDGRPSDPGTKVVINRAN